MKSGSRRPFVTILVLVIAAICIFAYVKHKKSAAAADAAGGDASANAGSAGGGADAGGGDGSGKGHKGGGTAGVPATPVQVQTVKNGNVSATVSVTGDINALHDINLAAKASGGVLNVNFREGNVVRAGQVIVQQDTTDLEATVRQDQAQMASDQAKLDQARENYAIQVTQSRQNVLNAEASFSGAQQSYLKLKRGNRPQDILQAEATTLQSKATLDNAQVTLARDKGLYPEGAIPKSQLDSDNSAYEADLAAYKHSQAAEQEEKIGYQQEDINAAQETVREQKANLQNQIANQRLVAVQKGAVESALAVLSQDRNKLIYDQTQVSYAIIRSPIDGIVAARETEPGEIATSGTALMRIVNIDTLYYEPTISETDWQATHVGDPVNVTVDALPGQNFHGRVAALFPAADTTTRVFSLRVLVDNPQHVMRPGMFARGTLVTKVAKQVPIVPTSALVSAATQAGFEANDSSDAPVSQGMQLPAQQVVVLRSDKTAEVRSVTLGIVTMDKAQILSGVQAGDQIVIVGQQGLKTGDKLTVSSAANSASSTADDGGNDSSTGQGAKHHHKGGKSGGSATSDSSNGSGNGGASGGPSTQVAKQ